MIEDADRIPDLLRAVTNPEEFEPFRRRQDPATFETDWEQSSGWVLANLAHTAYHPPERIEALARRLGATSVRTYSVTNAEGFLAVWPWAAVVAFRGTKLNELRPLPPGIVTSMKTLLEDVFDIDLPDEYRALLANDLLADITFVKKTLGGAAVHQGFLGELEKLWGAVAQDLDRLTTRPAVPVFVTGHSLGGAMATIAGMRHAFRKVVTFGEPRVGSNVASEFRAERHVRFVNGNDPIPMLPPAWWPFSYEHHGEVIEVKNPSGPNALYDHSIVYYAQNMEPGTAE